MNEFQEKIMSVIMTHLLVTIGLFAGYVLTIKGIDIFKVFAGWSVWCMFIVFVMIVKESNNG